MLYPQAKSHWYPLDKRLDRPQSQYGHNGEKKKISLHCMPGIKPQSFCP